MSSRGRKLLEILAKKSHKSSGGASQHCFDGAVTLSSQSTTSIFNENEGHRSKKIKLLEYLDQTELFPGSEPWETASAVVELDQLEKIYVNLQNVTETNTNNKMLESSITSTLISSDNQLEIIANTDGIGIIPIQEIALEQTVILNNDLNLDEEIAEKILDINNENKSEQEHYENPNSSETIENKETENKDLNKAKKTDTNENKKTKQKNLKKAKKVKNLNAPQLLEPCKMKCRQKCQERLNEEERKIIFKSYNDLNFREKRLFLDKHIVKKEIKYRKVDAGVPRRFAMAYNLPHYVKKVLQPENDLSDSQPKTNIEMELPIVNAVDDEMEQENSFSDLQSSTENVIVVCKSMFMNTLGLRSDSIITDYLKRTPNDLPINLKDKRGQKRAEAVKVIADKNYAAVKKHIDSYHPQVSHYNLEHAPNKRYLPCDITIREMYKDFLSKFNKISYETYRKIFDKENIGFASPTQDECGMCSTYKNHVHENNMPTTSTSTDHGLEDEEARLEELGKAICDICKKYDVHKTRYTVARKQYNEDSNKKWTNDFEIYSVDMQKVLILPKMTIKNSFFVSRLVAFHETFANLQAAHENKCVLWHEAIRGRNGPDVVSAFYNVLKRLSNETKHVIFWTDNCTAQNKNWTLFTACVLFVNEEWGPESITFKYFEPGHSFMKADSVHGLIGKKWKHTPEVLDYEDLVHLIESSNKLNKVINLRVEDFLEFENACQTRKKGTDLPKLNEIKCVQFVKGSKKLFFKHELEHESFSEVSFLKPKLKLVLPKQITVERGINQKKKDTIIKELTQYMPPRKQIFWKNLPSREDVEDLGISTAHS